MAGTTRHTRAGRLDRITNGNRPMTNGNRPMAGGINRWRATVGPAGATDDDAVRRAGRELLARWSEPHRYHHTVEHLTMVLDVVDRYADRVERPDLVRLAAW